MSKLPAFQFYPADWRKDPGVQSLTFEERGIWFEILCLMHESLERGVLLLNGKPMTEEVLARILGVDKQKITTTISTLLERGVAGRRVESDGALINRRMVRDEHIRKVRTDAGKKGGNPEFSTGKANPYYKQTDNQTHKQTDKQKITPSSSSSSSSSDIESKALGHRKKREPFTPPTIEEVTAYCLERKNGIDPQKFIDHYTNTGWRIGKPPGYPMKDWRAAIRKTWEGNNGRSRAADNQCGPGGAHEKTGSGMSSAGNAKNGAGHPVGSPGKYSKPLPGDIIIQDGVEIVVT